MLHELRLICIDSDGEQILNHRKYTTPEDRRAKLDELRLNARKWQDLGYTETRIEDDGEPKAAQPAPIPAPKVRIKAPPTVPSAPGVWARMSVAERIEAVTLAMRGGHTNRTAAALLGTTHNAIAGLRNRFKIPARPKPGEGELR
jgi:hypothetical protein